VNTIGALLAATKAAVEASRLAIAVLSDSLLVTAEVSCLAKASASSPL
jgi:hypothetical protein